MNVLIGLVVNTRDQLYFCVSVINLLHTLVHAVQSVSLTENDELSDQLAISAKISQLICHSGETERHPSSMRLDLLTDR